MNASKMTEKEEKEYCEKISKTNSGKFLLSLYSDGLFWTDDLKSFYLIRDEIDCDGGQYRVVVGLVNLEIVPNSYLRSNEWIFNAVHIHSIVVADEYRGAGTLGCICSLLIRAADENGVFLFGHARPFYAELPKLKSSVDIEAWKPNAVSAHTTSLAREKKESKNLLRKYLEYGFCRFDGHGIKMANRFWKERSFGYLGSGISDSEIGRFVIKHLAC